MDRPALMAVGLFWKSLGHSISILESVGNTSLLCVQNQQRVMQPLHTEVKNQRKALVRMIQLFWFGCDIYNCLEKRKNPNIVSGIWII